MIILTHNNTQHGIPTDWQDLTIEQAMKLRSITMPLIDHYLQWFDHEETLDKIINAASTLPTDTISPAWKVKLVTEYLQRFVIQLRMETIDYLPRLIDSFTHEGVKYYLPATLDMISVVILNHDTSAKRFTEAANLLKLYGKMIDGGIYTLPLFVATVVKETPDEKYNEQVIVERAKRFHTLPMSDALEVFFCSSALLYREGNAILRSLMEKEKEMTPTEKLDLKYGSLLRLKAELLVTFKRLMK